MASVTTFMLGCVHNQLQQASVTNGIVQRLSVVEARLVIAPPPVDIGMSGDMSRAPVIPTQVVPTPLAAP
eukprot:664166-Prorocentrum_lima.AAC.1